MTFKEYVEDQRKAWNGSLKAVERNLEKALFPARPEKEFYETDTFKEDGLCGTKWGEDYYMWLQIRLDQYKFELEHVQERLARLDRLTESQWKAETKSLWSHVRKTEFENRKYDTRDRVHAFRQ